MADPIDKIAKELVKAIPPKSKTSPYDTQAVVKRVDGDTAWVHIPGGVDETPVQLTTNAKKGDIVQVRVSGGRAWLYGNATSPPTDDTKAIQADSKASKVMVIAVDAQELAESANHYAGVAKNAADNAQISANNAATAASNAQSSASTAARMANNALAGLSTLESVIDTVNWFADHKTASTDTTVDPSKTYYFFDSSTGTLSAVTPEGTENPSEEGWYELDETIQNYVVTHVAETDDGLYVVGLSSGWKILVSNGSGNYAAGVFLIDPYGGIAQATTANGITFDETKPFYIGDEDAYVVFDGNGGINIGGDVTIGGSKSLSDILSELNSSIKTIEYGKGTSQTSHSDITSWSTSTPTWESGKYIWMRTTTNGLSYTYTCIQGAQGPQGATGASGSSGARGTLTLGVTTAPSSYTTTVGGFSPKYRISLSTVLTQSGATDVQVGDIVLYSYYEYPVGYVSDTYVYTGTRKNIRGATGEQGPQGETGATGADGATGATGTSMRNKGEWTSGQYYYASGGYIDVVTLSGNTYICKSSHSAALSNKPPNSTFWALAASKGATGEQGPQGETGAPGEDGTSITVSSITYAISTTETQPADSSFTYSSVPTVAEGSWLWTKTVYSDNTKVYTKAKQGEQGPIGETGAPGDDGISITSMVPYYLAQDSSLSAPTFSASTISNWSTTEPALDMSKTCYVAYLTTFSNSTLAYSSVSVMSEYEASKTSYNIADNARNEVIAANASIDQINDNISDINDLISAQGNTITVTKDAVESIQNGYIRWDATASKMIQVVNPDGSQEVVNDFLSGWLQFTMDTTINKPVLSLGSNSDGDMSVNLRPDRLSFLQGGNEVAYISNNTLFITQSVVLEQMDVGRKVNDTPSGLGQWSWRVHSVNYSGTMRNNLYLKWLG